VDRGHLFQGSRLIIPADYQEQVLDELHVGHQGIVNMKGLARSHGGQEWTNRLKIWFGAVKHVSLLGINLQWCPFTHGLDLPAHVM